MAWTTPASYSVGEVVTASKLNLQVRDNLRYLKGLDGAVDIEAALVASSTAYPTLAGERSVGTTTGLGAATATRLKSTSGSISDGFGAVHAFEVGPSSGTGIVGGIGAVRDGASTQGALVFLTNNTLTERARITQAGNVGLGTAVPQQRLHSVQDRGAMLHYGGSGAFSTATVIIPAAATNRPEANTYVVAIRSVLGSDNVDQGGVTQVFSSSGSDQVADLYNNAGNQLVIRVRTTGQVEIERLAGSLTYKVSLLLIYTTAT